MTLGTATASGPREAFGRASRPGQPTVVIEPRKSLFHLELGVVWQYRELLYFLVWREIKVRYKQTAIGIAWAIIQPLAAMAIFTLVFGYFARIPSDGLPYPIFAYAALLPWTYFAQALSGCGHSLVGDAGLLKKVYFPRLIIPIAAVARPLVDFFLSFLVFLAMMAWWRIPLTRAVLLLPFFLLLALFTALAVGLWLSALNVRYRDVGHTLPFLVQLWMFASPVVYPMSLVPEAWRWLYGLNPMVSVIDGFRWALLGTKPPDLTVSAISAGAAVILLLGGIIFFRRLEPTFADVI